MSRILDSIVELQSVLSQLRVERGRYDTLPAETRELETARAAIEQELATLEETAREADSQRRAAEGEAALCQERLAHYQQQIDRVQTQREYGALLSEIDAMNAKRRGHEEIALGALERHEQATATRVELAQRFVELDATYQEQRAGWEEGRPELAKLIADLESQATTLRDRLPAAVLAQYDRLYELHSGDPLARVLRLQRAGGQAIYRCSVCNYSVRPQVVVELQNTGGLVSCDCGRQRIFYYQE
jgi:predicted  nucleic acid-binding Zn-ribbon protein